METSDSVVGQVPNLRTLLNKATFQKLPPEYQYKLSRLMPQVDRVEEADLTRYLTMFRPP